MTASFPWQGPAIHVSHETGMLPTCHVPKQKTPVVAGPSYMFVRRALYTHLIALNGRICVQQVHPTAVLGAVKHRQGPLGDGEVCEVQYNNAQATIAVLKCFQLAAAKKSAEVRGKERCTGGGGGWEQRRQVGNGLLRCMCTGCGEQTCAFNSSNPQGRTPAELGGDGGGRPISTHPQAIPQLLPDMKSRTQDAKLQT